MALLLYGYNTNVAAIDLNKTIPFADQGCENKIALLHDYSDTDYRQSIAEILSYSQTEGYHVF
jgi:hypothetical protein